MHTFIDIVIVLTFTPAMIFFNIILFVFLKQAINTYKEQKKKKHQENPETNPAQKKTSNVHLFMN